MKRYAYTTLVVLALAGAAHAADRTVDQTRRLAADGRVEISNISGDVRVIGWSADEVNISGRLEDGVEDLEISSAGDRLRIEVDLERRTRNNGSAFLTIKMPATADLEVETVSAGITVDGVTGEINLESVSGQIEVSGGSGSLEAASVSGSVRATSTSGRSELESVSGNIIVGHAAGRLGAEVVSGNIEIEAGLLDSLVAESVSGKVFCAAKPTENGRFSLETMSGTVELVVSADIDADFGIETYSGSIRNEIGPEPVRTDRYGPGRELRFRSGAGGARISVESFSGNVKLRVD
jgi:DUF4097 and DUF4098 domain-containing protein YvlB